MAGPVPSYGRVLPEPLGGRVGPWGWLSRTCADDNLGRRAYGWLAAAAYRAGNRTFRKDHYHGEHVRRIDPDPTGMRRV